MKSETIPASTSEQSNLISNPSLEVNATGWDGGPQGPIGATSVVARAGAQAHSGGWSLSVVTPSSASFAGASFAFGSLASGQTVSARAMVRVPTTQNITVAMEDNLLGNGLVTSTVSVPANTWTALTVTWTPSALSMNARLYVYQATTLLAQTWYLDAAIVSYGSTVPTYFDGDTPGYGWFAAAHGSASGSLVSVLRDLETGSTYQSVKDSWVITPGQRKPNWAQSQRRYGGARQTGETHENGSIGWSVLVKNATADTITAAAEAMVGDLEALVASTQDVYVEWRPDGSSVSTYYEVRGPATWQPNYKWAQFTGAGSMVVDIRIPVAPLAELASYSIPITSRDPPSDVVLPSAITGTAPARADISLTTSGGASPPLWAMLAWTRRGTAPLATASIPFGAIEAEVAFSNATWSVTSDADYRGSSGLQATTSGAGTANALYTIDPSTVPADEFSRGEVAVEVWARIELASTVVSPRMFLSLRPYAGTSFGAEQYSSEWGAAGKLITIPSSGTRFRFVKLGTLNLPVDTAQPLKHNLVVAASWATGSSGTFGLDYLVVVPVRQRALSPSSKPNDSTYPDFIGSTGATTKTIRHDLSGRVASGAGNPGRDSGLGGSLIELPPGNVDLFIKLSSLVPDDPTSDATSEQIYHVGVTGSVRVTPRVWLAG